MSDEAKGKAMGKRESAGWHWFIFKLKNDNLFMAKAQLSPYFIDWQNEYPKMFRLQQKTVFKMHPQTGDVAVSKSLDCYDRNCEIFLPSDNVAHISNAGHELKLAADEHWGDKRIVKATPAETSKIVER